MKKYAIMSFVQILTIITLLVLFISTNSMLSESRENVDKILKMNEDALEAVANYKGAIRVHINTIEIYKKALKECGG